MAVAMNPRRTSWVDVTICALGVLFALCFASPSATAATAKKVTYYTIGQNAQERQRQP